MVEKLRESIHLQVHCPEGQAQEEPQLQEHPGPDCKKSVNEDSDHPKLWQLTHGESYEEFRLLFDEGLLVVVDVRLVA